MLALWCSVAAAQTPPTATTTTTTTTTAIEPTATEPPATPDERFRRGKRLFEYRDCPGTIATLIDLAIPGLLGDETLQLEVHRMLGICYALDDERREASREFSSLLSLDPDHQLDPFEVPPPVIDIFEQQKQAMKARLDELRKARERAKDDFGDEGGVLVERVTTVRETPFATAFLPFGLAQVANGDTGKAAAFGIAQGVGLVANVIGYWGSVVVVDQGTKNEYTQEEANLENVFWYGHLIGAGVLLVSYGAGVADALWNLEAEAITASKATKRPLTAGELKKLRRIERAPAPLQDVPPALDAPATPTP